jgi:preprotein translocase subunit SecA
MLGLKKLGTKVFGSANERIIRQYLKRVEEINAHEAETEKLSDDEIKARTDAFRDRLAAGETLEDVLSEAFALVREAAKRTLGQRHFDVQMVGGMVLHEGQIAEMKTGEGKTLVATLAAYLNALSGDGVHIVTVNDYLAARDAEWMGQIYEILGLSVGVIVAELEKDERRLAYAADITYGTNNEFGFDYLRDNLAFRLEDMVQRPFNFAIVDEVDSILIDEARTPLIISGPTEDKSQLYITVDRVVAQLGAEDYEKDEKVKAITLTEEGTERIEQLLNNAKLLETENLYDYENTLVVHHVNNALKARQMFERDTDYIVKDDRVIIIDEFTGRMMEGRRYSDGLHQALEAKEGANIQPENQTLASITFQNYFRMYPKLAGMTGTASTEAEEFANIYALLVTEVPTHEPVIRLDEHDEFYRTADEKFAAILDEIKDCRERGQPVLVGTVSIEKSELLSELMKKHKVPHNVLNARYHEKEAQIIAQAGVSGAVTIATNMAGRGTDIQLGGNIEMRIKEEADQVEDPAKRQTAIEKIKAEVEANKKKVIEAGGCYIIATERHESRRIDNQLRGRSGRQGDPGRSKFYLSLQDDLMRIFGPERMDSMLVKLGIEEGEAIIHPWINKAIEKAQQKVEGRNFDIRKNVVKFDNVMNDQRSVIYDQRKDIMAAEEISDAVKDMRAEVVENQVLTHVPPKSYADQWDLEGLRVEMRRLFNLDLSIEKWGKEEGVEETVLIERVSRAVERYMVDKAASFGDDWQLVEKSITLQILDQDWKEHLSELDNLRAVIHLRAYGQRDPLNEYKTEAFSRFEAFLSGFREHVCAILSHVEISASDLTAALAPKEQELVTRHEDPRLAEGEAPPPEPLAPIMTRAAATTIDPQDPSSWGKVRRNAPCPCGSGKKYKHCHGRLAH